jgi:hypothetical protein
MHLAQRQTEHLMGGGSHSEAVAPASPLVDAERSLEHCSIAGCVSIPGQVGSVMALPRQFLEHELDLKSSVSRDSEPTGATRLN